MDVAATTTPAVRHELVPQLQFPPGFRFVPTEEELVDVYLRAKIEGHKLPLAVVNDVSILDWQPGKLVEEYKGYGENRWFFFTVREQSSSNKEKEPSRKVRVEGVTATWKATGSVQLIRRRAKSKDEDKVVVGSKRVLIYNSSDPHENGKWSMHEYILEGHAEIGQYALYSIQRKQHSDTQDNAGNDDMDPKKKTTNKRKRTEMPSTELEGVQLPHPETTTTLLAKPPLKPTRKAKAQRKKASMQVAINGEQHQQQGQGKSPMEPVTPPKKDELAPSSSQQEGRQQPPAPADGDGAPAPVAVLSAVPLQAVRVCPPSEPDVTLGGSAPPTLKKEDDTPTSGMFSEDTVHDMSRLWALMDNPLCYAATLCDNKGRQEQWPPSLAGTTTAFLAAPPDTNVAVDHDPFQPYQYQKVEDDYSLFAALQNQHLTLGENQSGYMWQGQGQGQYADLFLHGNTTTPQPMKSSGTSEHGDHQSHQQVHHHQQLLLQEQENNGGAFGGVVQDQQPMDHLQGGHDHDLLPVDEQSSGSDDSLLFGESGGVQNQMNELDAFVRGVLVPPPHQDLLAAGTQEQEQEGGDDPATTLQAAGTQEQGADDAVTLQSLQHDELRRQQLACLQLQRAFIEHVRDGPCSCTICAAGLWHYYFPGP